ncbi:MAG: DUF6745 domain-containing protein, partial [Vulcanimicrobiaceae bacterium]
GEWTAFDEWVEFLRVVCGYERDGRVDFTNWQPWHDATMHGGVRIMHAKFCIVSDRPEFIRMETVNGRGRLHCADGPAKRYRDGWSIYAVHGVRVPAQVIEAPHTMNAKQILSEQNAEVRRVIIERFGSARLIREGGAKLVDESIDALGAPQRLWLLPLENDEPIAMVDVRNSSPEPINFDPGVDDGYDLNRGRYWKRYWLRVPPTTKTAAEAIAWTVPVKKYAPAVQS